MYNMSELDGVNQLTTEDIIHTQARSRRIYRLGLVLICITIGFCSILYLKLRIKSPVVLPVCLEIAPETIDTENKTGSGTFSFYYVNNRGNQEHVEGVTFTGHPDLKGYGIDGIDPSAPFMFYDTSTVWNYVGSYEIHRVYVVLQNIPLRDTVEINQLNLHWSNGKTTTEDVGKIVICNDVIKPGEIEQYSSSTDSDGVTSITCTANTDLTIQSLTTELMPEDFTDLTVTINGEEYEAQSNPRINIPLKQGEKITLTFQGNDLTTETDNPRWNQFSYRPKLMYRTTEGKEGCCSIWSIDNEQNWSSQWKLHKYVEKLLSTD